ncbi:hypothetical protein EJB05_31301, partial [Eragrostis curvula]
PPPKFLAPPTATTTASSTGPLHRLRLRLAACVRAPPTSSPPTSPSPPDAAPPALRRRRPRGGLPWKLTSSRAPHPMDPPPSQQQQPQPPRPPSPPPPPQPPAPSRRYGVHFSASSFIQAPLSALLEYSGILRPDPGGGAHQAGAGAGEVSIRIVGSGDAGASSERAEEVIVEEEEEGHATRAQPAEPAPAASGGEGARESSSSYQRYDIQQVARWVEQILPFSLLLLVVFIRQHLQGFFVTIWIAAVMFKSNDILRKQTALKRERKIPVLVGITILFVVHVFGFYWCYKNGDLIRPLLMVPPKEIPPFWHAIFIILVNDTMVRQTAMVVKCILLMYYKNSRGRSYRRQVQSFLTALRALSLKDFHYGSYATSEQVLAAGDMCAICQEKMHAPILLRCKHIFCEDCVSEWFERERTCPLCRALVKPADLRSFGDGSTSLFFQLF